ncbi:MAG: IS110 family transposase [Bacilli bacterium]|nr:IS110 family transposase [Bacilli bacterium]
MQNCLAIDVAKGKSMVSLISSCGEVLIDPYEINHSINDFTNLLNRIKKLKLDNASVIMESTGIYHRPIERFFLENNFKVYTINALYSKMYKRNLRKTKTDKLDCISLAELFFTTDFKQYIKPDDLYLNMNALSRQYFALSDLCANIKNRYKNLIYLCFPEYEIIFKGEMIYGTIALSFIEKYPHADIISNTRIDALQNFFKKNNFRYWKRKANIIKEYALKSYPSVNMNDESVSNLSQLARLIDDYQKEIETIKYKLVFLAKKSKYFESINSIFGIGEFTTSIIIAELGDINRFNNIKKLTAYCGLDPSIKQSGRSIDIHGPISKSGNKYLRKILFVSCLNIVRLSPKCHVQNYIEIYYRKKRNEGKHHYAATIACTTKLLRKILALCKQLDK